MNATKIEWALNPDGTPGYTWNPITGCLNGCDYCYARRLADTRLKERYLANKNISEEGLGKSDIVVARDYNPFYPRFWPERLNQAYKELHHDTKPRGIFVCDMSDLFGIGVPEEWTRRVLRRIKEKNNHRFYLLTKQPQNLIKFSPFPDNCWVGVSATATDTLSYINACNKLILTTAKVKYLSLEPLLSHIEMLSHLLLIHAGVKWVIIGAQTKPTVMPKIEWVQEIVQACDKAGIPVFLKDSLKPLMKPVYEQAGCISNFFTDGDGETPVLRQEHPDGK